MLCSQKILEKLSRRLKGLFHFFKKASVWVKQHWGQHCGDIELVGYLPNAVGPVSLVLDLRITHDRVGSSTDPTLNGNLNTLTM